MPSETAAKNLNEMIDAIWEFRLQRNPYLAIMAGVKMERLPDISLDEVQRKAAFAVDKLNGLHQIRLTELAHPQRLILKTLEWELERETEQVEIALYQFPVTPYSSPLSDTRRILLVQNISTPREADELLGLLTQVPLLLGDMKTRVMEQAGRGILIPVDELELVAQYLGGFLRAPAESPFGVDGARLKDLDAAQRDTFLEKVRQIIAGEINPRLEELINFLGGDYKKAAPQGVGMGQYPGGLAAYDKLIHLHTTLPLSAQTVHTLGLEAVEEINQAMSRVRSQLGFQGTRVEFHQFLKTDPRFFAKTPEEAGERLMAHMNRFAPLVSSVFRKLPAAPYGVRRLDPDLEKVVTFGYYEPPSPQEPGGYYFYNGSDLDQRSMLGGASLIYHELVPGHHFQLALQGENLDLPPVVRFGGHGAFVEGWAEYAAELAGELGMYADLYDAYGRLAMHMFTAVRLVVDTGMNAFGWSRAKAASYMREHILESEVQINTETLRYSVDIPAQALGYKIGNFQMHTLRERQKQRLGNKFDICSFHEQVLKYGSMPLSVLDWHLDQEE
jgi:uncharacterized protein (DUF885 family)